MDVPGAILGMMLGGGSSGGVSKAYVDAQDALKVDKVEGKGLSTNDYTNADKALVAESPVSASATGTSFTLTDAADARLQELKIKGNSAVVSGEIKSIGDNGLTVTIAQTGQTSRTFALTSGLPLRSVSAGVYDMLDAAAGVVSKKCVEIDLSTLAWETSSTQSVFIGKGLSPACVNDDAAEQGVCAEYTVSSVNKLYANTAGNMALGVSNNRVYLRNDTYTDAASLTTALSGVKLVYPLATPTETALTAAEMTAWRAFRTFEGNNTISATDSPEMTVTYIKNTDNGKALARAQDDAEHSGGYRAELILSEPNGLTLNAAYSFLNGANLDDFDELHLVVSTPGDITELNGYGNYNVNLTALRDMNYPVVLYSGYGNRAMYISFTNTTVKVTFSSSYGEAQQFIPNIYRIYGIKY